jgi:hypothetical protein
MGSMKIWNGTAWEVASQQGPAGPVVLPVGGTTGQVLAKRSASDYDTAWSQAGSRQFSSGGTVGYTIPPAGVSATVPLAAFTLTTPSLVIVHGMATVTRAAGTTIQGVDVRFWQAAGGAAPVSNPGSFMSGTPFPDSYTLPVWASFGTQPAGACTLGIRGSSGAGGVTLILSEVYWTAFIQPT